MADSLGPEQLHKLALLARLQLSDDEQPRYARDLQSILVYMDKLNECDTRDVAPTEHATDQPSRWREDTAHAGMPLERALRNAPERIGDGFGVPKIIE